MKYWALRFIGFVVGAGLTLVLEIGLLLLIDSLTGRMFIPRGAGWLLLPIAIGITTGAAAPQVWLRVQQGGLPLLLRFRSLTLPLRAAVAFTVFWPVCVAAYVYLFEPYGAYMWSQNYYHMFKVMLFPPVVVFSGVLLYTKFVAPASADTNKPET